MVGDTRIDSEDMSTDQAKVDVWTTVADVKPYTGFITPVSDVIAKEL